MYLDKIIGWILILVGILIIIWTLFAAFNIFTARDLPPQIFSSGSENKNKVAQFSPSNQDLEEQMKQIIREQIKSVVPTEDLLKLFNLLSWSIFSGILIFGGARISELGIKLIKK